MLYVVVVVCVLKIMYCVGDVFMIQQLKSMSIPVHPNLNLLDLFEKVFFSGANMKYSCSTPQHKIVTPVPQSDPL